jgi:hypothetical protein
MPYISSPENLAILSNLASVLREVKIGELLPKSRLDNLLSGKMHLLNRARRLVEEEQGCIFATIVGHGIKKLDPADANLVGQRARQKARRGLGRAQTQIVGVVRTNEGLMLAQDKVKLTQELNRLGLAIEFCQE